MQKIILRANFFQQGISSVEKAKGMAKPLAAIPPI
jgi:hypothetical protein